MQGEAHELTFRAGEGGRSKREEGEGERGKREGEGQQGKRISEERGGLRKRREAGREETDRGERDSKQRKHTRGQAAEERENDRKREHC